MSENEGRRELGELKIANDVVGYLVWPPSRYQEWLG